MTKWVTSLFLKVLVTHTHTNKKCLSGLQTTGVDGNDFRKDGDRNQGYFEPFLKVSAISEESPVWSVQGESLGLRHAVEW